MGSFVGMKKSIFVSKLIYTSGTWFAEYRLYDTIHDKRRRITGELAQQFIAKRMGKVNNDGTVQLLLRPVPTNAMTYVVQNALFGNYQEQAERAFKILKRMENEGPDA